MPRPVARYLSICTICIIDVRAAFRHAAFPRLFYKSRAPHGIPRATSGIPHTAKRRKLNAPRRRHSRFYAAAHYTSRAMRARARTCVRRRRYRRMQLYRFFYSPEVRARARAAFQSGARMWTRFLVLLSSRINDRGEMSRVKRARRFKTKRNASRRATTEQSPADD